jgi:hypothetical protein
MSGCYHPRQDAGVDDGGTRARRQAVELGDLVAAGWTQAGVVRALHHQHFVRIVVDAEGVAGDDDLGAGSGKRGDRRAHSFLADGIDVDESVLRRQEPAGGEFDRADRGLTARQQWFQPARHADDAYDRHIAFEQGIGRLGRAVGEEDDVDRIDGGALEDIAEHFDDPPRDAARIVVGGQYRVPADNRAVAVVDQHRLRECAADIDADAEGAPIGTFCISHQRLCSIIPPYK